MRMLHTTTHEHSQTSPQIKQDDKFFTRLLSKESSIANPSFRVLYYGGVPSSVPFMWESHPGTPKHSLTTISLPPLTPPPSYYSQQNSKNPLKRHSKPKLLKSMFFRVNVKKTSLSSSPSSLSSSSWSSSAWSSSSWSSSSNTSNFYGRRFSSKNSSFDERGDFEEDHEQVSPTSILCFGGGRKENSIVVMKKTLLAMVGRGSGH